MKLTKGDSASIRLNVVDSDGKERAYTSTDTIVMTVRKTPSSPVAFTKTAVENQIAIEPSDTSSLSTGTYLYDIQLTTVDGNVFTIVPQSIFELTEEITQ